MREIVVTPRSPSRNIPLYQEGEDGATCIVFDLAPYITQWGDGTAEVLHQRQGDAAPYPVQLTQEGDRARWLVQSEDIRSGSGRLQLIWRTETAVARSPVLCTLAAASLGAETDPPDTERPWLDTALQAAADAEESARRAEDAAAILPTPSTADVGRVPAVNAEGTGYELVYVGGGGIGYKIGHGLKVTNGDVLQVDAADAAQQDNTLPITSAAVYQITGNIDALLQTI